MMKASTYVIDMRFIKNGIFLTLMVLMTASPSLAHKASIFAWVEGNTVHTQSKLMGGTRPEQASVEVFDKTGNLLLKGKTDADGLFSFQAPMKSDMQIVLTAGMGHRAVWALSRGDFQETAAEPDDNRRLEAISPGNPDASSQRIQNADGPPEDRLTAADVAALVESALDRKLKPLMDKVAALNEHRITLPDILGGIGYIVGLVGLAAYIQYRRKRRTVKR